MTIYYVGGRSSLLDKCIQTNTLPLGKRISFAQLAEFYHNGIDLSSVSIVLFSLPEIGDEDFFLSVIKSITSSKLINISSTSIYADIELVPLPFRRYPSLKLAIHNAVAQNVCGLNIVAGIFDVSFPSTCFPLSDIYSFCADIKRALFSEPLGCNLIYSFGIHQSSVSSLATLLIFSRRILACQLLLPLSFLMDLFLKVFRFKNRSYTFLSTQRFSRSILIGDGAFATSIYSSSDLVIRSNSLDFVETEEFLNTKTGKSPIGLDKLRHGVITYENNGKVYKKWVPSLRLRLPFRKVWDDPVKSLEILKDSFLMVHTYSGRLFFTPFLKIACGALENIRLIASLDPGFDLNTITLSDHFISLLGYVDFDDLYLKHFVRKTFFPFVYRRRHLDIVFDDFNKPFALIEPRLSLDSEFICFKPFASFLKLISSIYSYLFNRLGLFVPLPNIKVEIYAQILLDNCLGVRELPSDGILRLYSGTDIVSRRHLLSSLCIRYCQSKFSSFTPMPSSFFSPSHHLHGAPQLLSSPIIKKLINDKILFIGGSPSSCPLGVFHHTIRIARNLRDQLRSLFVK